MGVIPAVRVTSCVQAQQHIVFPFLRAKYLAYELCFLSTPRLFVMGFLDVWKRSLCVLNVGLKAFTVCVAFCIRCSEEDNLTELFILFDISFLLKDVLSPLDPIIQFFELQLVHKNIYE